MLLAGIATLACGCRHPVATTTGTTIRVDRTTKYQTVEGFGFFGAQGVWWGPSAGLVSQDWVRMAIDDLGLSMWRNEYFPPADASGAQDTDWTKQRPMVTALRDQARKSGVPLKMIVTVWSPPASMKCLSDDGGVHDGTPNPGGTKKGGAVCPGKREAFANWLNEGLQLYADAGVTVYGLSLQNEPAFTQPYNSGQYPRDVYAATLAEVGPRIHARFPAVKLFAAENMLGFECKNGTFDPSWYTGSLLRRPDALSQVGAFAVHGYLDGVLATPTSTMAQTWSCFRDAVRATGKPVWMTETSGYIDSWEAGPNAAGAHRPGALDLAQAIFAALYYGRASAWVWWQGSQTDLLGEFNLMKGTTVGKRYYVAKQFFRFIRPGARMVATTSDDQEVLVASFEHAGIGNFVTILINGGRTSKTAAITGAGVPASLAAYRTSATESFVNLPSTSTSAVVLPPRSITTLIGGGFLDTGSAAGVNE